MNELNPKAIGARYWAIAEGYIPETGTGQGRAFESHETACLLNGNGLQDLRAGRGIRLPGRTSWAG